MIPYLDARDVLAERPADAKYIFNAHGKAVWRRLAFHDKITSNIQGGNTVR
jgi:hypothetical protein